MTCIFLQKASFGVGIAVICTSKAHAQCVILGPKHCHNVYVIMLVLLRLRAYVRLICVCVLFQVAVKDRMVQVHWLFVSIDRHETILIVLHADSSHNAVSCVF